MAGKARLSALAAGDRGGVPGACADGFVPPRHVDQGIEIGEAHPADVSRGLPAQDKASMACQTGWIS